LASHHHVVFHDHAAAEADLSAQNAVAPDLAVVRDLHQVVDLGASPTRVAPMVARSMQTLAPILDIVFDDDRAQLRHFVVLAAIHHVAEAVAAQHGAGMDAHALADMHMMVDDTEGIKNGFVADLRAVADHAVRIDNGTVTDMREVTDITVLANGDAFTDMRVRLDNRGGWIPGSGFRSGWKYSITLRRPGAGCR
jgi:hypothetical protein